MNNDILGRAMLANVSVSVWEARKHDRQITRRVNDRYAASQNAGRWHKHLFGGQVDEHQAVLALARKISEAHKLHTLPWTDSAGRKEPGWRLLPTDNFFEHAEAVRIATADFLRALEEDFLPIYPELIERGRERLNGMFDRQDYPSVAEVRRKFAARVEHQPLPSGGDFRVTLPSEELARVAADVEARVAGAVDAAMRDAWGQLAGAVGVLSGRLGDGKHLRETMVEKIARVSEALGRLNVTGDPALDEMRERAARELGSLDVNVLREDVRAREDAASKAAAILAAMRGLYDAPKEEGS